MKNEEVAKLWVKNVKAGNGNNGAGCGSNMSFAGKLLYSYSTPIAKWTGRRFEMSTKKYSPTTSRHQTYTLRAIQDSGKPYTFVTEVK